MFILVDASYGLILIYSYRNTIDTLRHDLYVDRKEAIVSNELQRN